MQTHLIKKPLLIVSQLFFTPFRCRIFLNLFFITNERNHKRLISSIICCQYLLRLDLNTIYHPLRNLKNDFSLVNYGWLKICSLKFLSLTFSDLRFTDHKEVPNRFLNQTFMIQYTFGYHGISYALIYKLNQYFIILKYPKETLCCSLNSILSCLKRFQSF